MKNLNKILKTDHNIVTIIMQKNTTILLLKPTSKSKYSEINTNQKHQESQFRQSSTTYKSVEKLCIKIFKKIFTRYRYYICIELLCIISFYLKLYNICQFYELDGFLQTLCKYTIIHTWKKDHYNMNMDNVKQLFSI